MTTTKFFSSILYSFKGTSSFKILPVPEKEDKSRFNSFQNVYQQNYNLIQQYIKWTNKNCTVSNHYSKMSATIVILPFKYGIWFKDCFVSWKLSLQSNWISTTTTNLCWKSNICVIAFSDIILLYCVLSIISYHIVSYHSSYQQTPAKLLPFKG